MKRGSNEAMFFGRRGGFFMAARIAILAILLLAVFVFHAHGSTLRVLQVLRLVLLVALFASAFVFRRRRF
jgi:hypothetical protein